MDYDVVVKALKFLKTTHPSYKKVRIASADECKWEEQSTSVHQDPIIVNDKVSEAHEAHIYDIRHCRGMGSKLSCATNQR